MSKLVKMDTIMQRRIIYLFIFPLLFLITIGDSSDTFAQVQNVPSTPAVPLISDPIEAAHDHYHERRYPEAIKMYEELLEKVYREILIPIFRFARAKKIHFA